MLISYVYGELCINFEIRIMILPSHPNIILAQDVLGVNELQPPSVSNRLYDINACSYLELVDEICPEYS